MPELTIEKIHAAMDAVDDDLPDGAYWAMVHDILGVEYGEIFPLLAEDNGVEIDGSDETCMIGLPVPQSSDA